VSQKDAVFRFIAIAGKIALCNKALKLTECFCIAAIPAKILLDMLVEGKPFFLVFFFH